MVGLTKKQVRGGVVNPYTVMQLKSRNSKHVTLLRDLLAHSGMVTIAPQQLLNFPTSVVIGVVHHTHLVMAVTACPQVSFTACQIILSAVGRQGSVPVPHDVSNMVAERVVDALNLSRYEEAGIKLIVEPVWKMS
jgi:hypothetical protein